MSVNELEEILSSLPVAVIRTGSYGAAHIRRGLRERGAEAELDIKVAD